MLLSGQMKNQVSFLALNRDLISRMLAVPISYGIIELEKLDHEIKFMNRIVNLES
jgi:hypothetical protein